MKRLIQILKESTDDRPPFTVDEIFVSEFINAAERVKRLFFKHSKEEMANYTTYAGKLSEIVKSNYIKDLFNKLGRTRIFFSECAIVKGKKIENESASLSELEHDGETIDAIVINPKQDREEMAKGLMHELYHIVQDLMGEDIYTAKLSQDDYWENDQEIEAEQFADMMVKG